MKINEKCSCGSTFEAETRLPWWAVDAVAGWRRRHPCPNRRIPNDWPWLVNRAHAPQGPTK